MKSRKSKYQQIRWLEELVMDEAAIPRVERYTADFNFFDAIGVLMKELQHS